MKKISVAMTVFIVLIIGLAVSAHADLDGFLSNVNIQARADQNGFAAKLSTQFGIPGVQVRAVIGSVDEPADAFMIFKLGEMTNEPVDTVMQSYKANRGKGWGVIAKGLGIKPGSAQFHALKRGDFEFSGEPGRGAGKGKAKSKGKDKDKGKGRNK